MQRMLLLSKEQQEAVVKAYLSGLSIEDSGAVVGCNYYVAKRTLIDHGIKRRPLHGRKYTLNEAAFDTITEESAYWIGFLMADGCVMQRPDGTWYLELGLAEPDKEHVEAFGRFLESNAPIRTRIRKGYANRVPMSSIAVCSRRLCEALCRYGVVPRKTHIAKVIGLEDNRHFWRGAVDGDGFVTAKPQRNTEIQCVGLTGAHSLLTQFAAFVESTIGVSPKLQKSGTIYHATVGSRKAEELAHLLYDDCAVALPRKLAATQEIFASRARIKARREEKLEEMRTRRCSVPGCDRPYKSKGLCDNHFILQRQKSLRLDPSLAVRHCSRPGCGRAHYANDLCRNHYRQEFANRQPDPNDPSTSCTVEGCSGRRFENGLCSHHYNAARNKHRNRPPDPSDPSTFCKIPGCQSRRQTKGFCHNHYYHFRMGHLTAKGEAVPPPPPRVCSVPNCGKRHVARGYCRSHYIALHDTGKVCSAEDCGQKARTSGLCRLHWERQYRKEKASRPVGPDDVCSISGCQSRKASLGLCNRHYLQHRAGSLQVPGHTS